MPMSMMTSATDASLPKHVREIPDLRVVKVSDFAPPKYAAAQRGKGIKQRALASVKRIWRFSSVQASCLNRNFVTAGGVLN